MNIINAIAQLRDDLKIWVTHNLNALNNKIEEKTVTIDNILDPTSLNPVQNQAITNEINNLNNLIGDTTVSEQISQAISKQEHFSGDYNDLTNAPNIIADEENNLIIADKLGNIIFQIDEEGVKTTSVKTNGKNVATEEYVTQEISNLGEVATKNYVLQEISQIKDWFGNATSIPSNGDLDTYTTPGKYAVPSTAISNTIVNAPVTGTNYVLYTFVRTNGKSITQMIITLSNRIFLRSATSSGSLSAWVELGKSGYTPVKGVDYWTEDDKAEIKAYVDEAILGGEW